MKCSRHLVALLCAIPIAANSAEIGIGVSPKTSDASIYIPIDIGSRFRVEPSLRFSERTSESTSSGMNSSKSTSIGVGVFGLTRVTEDIAIYYGGRIGELEQKTTLRTTLVDPIGLFQPTHVDARSESDGHFISASAGLEYSLIERLSISLEVGLERSELDATQSVTGMPLEDGTIEQNDTRANIILRFFF